MAVSAFYLENVFAHNDKIATFLEVHIIDPQIMSNAAAHEHLIDIAKWESFLTEQVRKLLVARYINMGWREANFRGRWNQTFYLKR